MDPEQIERARRAHAKKPARNERVMRHPRCEAWVWGRKGIPGPHHCASRGTFGVVAELDAAFKEGARA